jgi:hypothetical protein
MGIGETIEFRGVKIVKESDLAVCCRIAGQDHWFTRERLLSGSSVVNFGDRGTLVLARWFAEDRGLLLTRPRTRP